MGRRIKPKADRKTDALRELAEQSRDAVKRERDPEIGALMSDGTIYAGISPDTHTRLFVAAQDHLSGSFNVAAQAVEKDNAERAHGHDDWRLPTKAELQMLFDNRHVGALKDSFNETGAFDRGWYWSSTFGAGNAVHYQQRFDDGTVNVFHMTSVAASRSVRG